MPTSPPYQAERPQRAPFQEASGGAESQRDVCHASAAESAVSGSVRRTHGMCTACLERRRRERRFRKRQAAKDQPAIVRDRKSRRERRFRKRQAEGIRIGIGGEGLAAESAVSGSVRRTIVEATETGRMRRRERRFRKRQAGDVGHRRARQRPRPQRAPFQEASGGSVKVETLVGSPRRRERRFRKRQAARKPRNIEGRTGRRERRFRKRQAVDSARGSLACRRPQRAPFQEASGGFGRIRLQNVFQKPQRAPFQEASGGGSAGGSSNRERAAESAVSGSVRRG